jgi:hypothetical protein
LTLLNGGLPDIEQVKIMRIRAQRLGLLLAFVMIAWHLTWAVLVATGLAQPLIDFIFWIHFITPVYRVVGFEPGRALLLITITGLFGYATGWIAGLIWNALHRPEP